MKYDYKILLLTEDSERNLNNLNSLGAMGWKLVAIMEVPLVTSYSKAYLMKEIHPEVSFKTGPR